MVVSALDRDLIMAQTPSEYGGGRFPIRDFAGARLDAALAPLRIVREFRVAKGGGLILLPGLAYGGGFVLRR